jgi:hypothetical protein
MAMMRKRTAVAGPDSGDEGSDSVNGKSPRQSFFPLFPLRQLSEGSYEAQCGTCLRFSSPVDAVSAEHAWSELIKRGWTWHTKGVGGTRYASCLECLRASTSLGVAAAHGHAPSG